MPVADPLARRLARCSTSLDDLLWACHMARAERRGVLPHQERGRGVPPTGTPGRAGLGEDGRTRKARLLKRGANCRDSLTPGRAVLSGPPTTSQRALMRSLTLGSKCLKLAQACESRRSRSRTSSSGQATRRYTPTSSSSHPAMARPRKTVKTAEDSDIEAIRAAVKAKRVVLADIALLDDAQGQNELYQEAVSAFERQYGRIEDLYIFDSWIAVARVCKKRFLPFRLLRASPKTEVITVFDAGTRPLGVSVLYSRLMDLETKGRVVLTFSDYYVTSQELVYVLSQLLRASNESPDDELNFRQARYLHERLRQLGLDYESAARRGAALIYFIGMLAGLVPVTLLVAFGGWLLPSIEEAPLHTIVGVGVAGELGAVISVVTRMTRNQFRVPPDTARAYVRFLGMVRPFIGAIFGVAVFCALASNLLFEVKGTTGQKFLAYLAFAFIAGFNERWARDVLTGFGGRALDATDDADRPNGQATPPDETHADQLSIEPRARIDETAQESQVK